MKHTKQSVATGESSFWKAGRNDAVLKKYLGAEALKYLANGKRPTKPMSNVEAARQYYLQQQKKKSGARS